jgi:hypothetical protein
MDNSGAIRAGLPGVHRLHQASRRPAADENLGWSQGVTVTLCNSALEEGRKLELSEYLAAASSRSRRQKRGKIQPGATLKGGSKVHRRHLQDWRRSYI